jgi:hypothetical protein
MLPTIAPTIAGTTQPNPAAENGSEFVTLFRIDDSKPNILSPSYNEKIPVNSIALAYTAREPAKKRCKKARATSTIVNGYAITRNGTETVRIWFKPKFASPKLTSVTINAIVL